MTTVAGPRYTPEDPTLPKPWIGLVDGKTGYLYFWNPETNITQYERPSSTSISSSVQVQQSSKRKHRDNSYNDDYGRYNKSSNNGSKFASESRNYEGGSYMIHDTPASYPLNVDNLISLQQEKRAYEEMEMVTYFREVDESDGFDVNIKTSMIGGIQPVNLYIEDMRVKCVGFAKFAIEAFNTREKDSEGKLKFGTLLKATFQVGYAYIYYLTFVAENLVKRCFDIYQAVVKKPCRGENKVLAFRPKPQGSRPIKWYWDDRCCGRNGDREKFK